ncbi:MAG: hypothetical protein GY856_39580 [bacterium]|nr:hypothetical protein [bacterium]
MSGDLVLAEPQATRLAAALAAKGGCEVERYRRPPRLTTVLADLRTYSLFASAKVVLVVDSAVLADRSAAADLIDQANEILPLADPDAELGHAEREGASRLLQALRVFGLDPAAGEPHEVVTSLPKWAFQGGRAYRKRRPNGRPAKEMKALREGLGALLAAALRTGLVGFAEGDLAEIGEIIEGGLPDGHALVLAEHSVSTGHPVVERLEWLGTSVAVGKVEAGRGGEWQGIAPLAEELARECRVTIARDALAELARRTLRQSGEWKNRGVDAESTARFAGEYRKLASLAGSGQITRQLVAESVEDRGEEDVWQILDALGNGRGGEALGRFQRLLAAADDAVMTRLSFFALLATFCRQLTAVAGMAELIGVPTGERNYSRFKNQWAPALQGELPDGGKNPLAGIHPFRLHRAYLAASRMPHDELTQLPWLVLETERRIKGDSSEADTAIAQLMARIVTFTGRSP